MSALCDRAFPYIHLRGNTPMAEATATILVVDDEANNRLLFTAHLKKEGYTAVAAASGEEALRFVAEHLPDLVLLDVMMPGINGFEVATRLKSDERTGHIPIIMVTALEDQESRLSALKIGAEEFLTKPIARAELLIRVRNLLKLKQYQDVLASYGNRLEAEVDARTKQLASAELRLNETQSKLLQSEKLASIGQLAAGVAHEINNPIGYVNANLGTLKQYIGDLFQILNAYAALESTLPADTPALAALREVKAKLELDYMLADVPALIQESMEGISRVCKIVQDLKDFSHADAHHEWKLADLRRGLDSTLNVAANEIKYKADVLKDYGDIPEVECLPSQLNQVFLNLLVNAAHAIGDGKRGTITVRTGCDSDSVWVEISDNGCGIPPENLDKIFEPFFTTKPIGKGTGLGLSLSYGIVREHGGRIDVESQPGQGTTFKIVIPIHRPPQ